MVCWGFYTAPLTTIVFIYVPSLGLPPKGKREEAFLREMRLMKRLRHPNLVQLLRTCTTRDGPLLLVLEFVSGGSLDNWLVRQATLSPRPSVSDLVHILHQVALGMVALGEASIVHR